ncbi:hypothetical protein AB205_0003790 [Aquarana catesbeiana]|uniref:C2H2-type domain-containing protein n=1 Tax=Aquarana catesbeiana TaxID=8400 RepID=A0A2G9RN74_AQUCT|nr:hypothetical protein AB205_0003790 [Aquarana catesbeiana]
MTHTGEKPCKCDAPDCDLSFTTMTNMRKHYQRAHLSPSLIYECYFADCGKTFKKHNQLKIHQYIHTNQQPYKNKTHLKDHKRTHEEERVVYKCPRDGCDRTYTKKFGLQSHILSFHEESRPFACGHPGCGKTFAMKQSLDRHANTHDPEKKKMKKPRPKKSLASRLSGYNPKKLSKTPKSVSELRKLPPDGPPDTATAMQNLSIK